MMKKLLMIWSLVLLTVSAQAAKPWDNGKLRVSDNQRYLQFENGQPFFWQGETGWLLPERLDRAEAEWYLQSCAKAGYNVVQVQTIDGVPAINIYGQMSNVDGWNMSAFTSGKTGKSGDSGKPYLINTIQGFNTKVNSLSPYATR